MSRGGVWWLVTAAIAVAAAGTAFFIGKELQPPPLIDASAVEQTLVVTAEVESRVLSEPVVFRADVVAEDSLNLSMPAIPEGSEPVLTSTHVEVGDTVLSGTLLLTVADRPVIALEGPVPMYRDIRPSLEGSDVESLQRGLVAVGYDIEVDGRYGRVTESAVVDFYSGFGLAPLHTGGEDELRQLEAEVDAARQSGDRSAISAAVAAHDGLREKIGFYVPRGEIAFIPALPRDVISVPEVGSLWADSDSESAPSGLRLTAGDLTFDGAVPVALSDLLTVGQQGVARDEASGDTFAIEVLSVGPDRVSDESGEWLLVDLVSAEPLPTAYLDRNLRIEINTESEGEVLAVPVTAVYASSDGSTYVRKSDGAEEEVVIGRVVGGWAELLSGAVQDGDLVIVGTQ